MTTKKPQPNAAKQEYEPTSEEKAVIDKARVRNAAASKAPRLKVVNEGLPEIALDHPDKVIGMILLMEELGTTDVEFLQGLLGQLANAGTQGRQIDERGLNFMLSVVKGIKPRDQIEAMLAAQMVAVHMATMTFAGRLAQVGNIQQQDSAERAFNKLARTYAAQMETLKRYRTGGEQKVTVQHVSVSEGGQAIVGNVTQAPRETRMEKAVASPPALAKPQQAPMTMVGEPAPMAIPSKRKPSK